MSRADPILSIVVTLKNTSAYHRELKRVDDFLDSLDRQTALGSFEVIVSDIDSEPEYRNIHRAAVERHSELNCKYIYTLTGKPWNVSRARNIGIKYAVGQYVMMVDIDCVFTPDFVEKIIANAGEFRILHCRVWELPERYAGRLDDYEAMKKVSTLRPAHGYGTCQVVSRAWAREVRGYDEQYELWGAEDTDFYIRAVHSGKVPVWIEDQTAYFHQWHSQGNRRENIVQLRKNRERLEKTKTGVLPIKRNPDEQQLRQGLPILFSDTCILITTFLRDDCLIRCIESIRRYYPDIKIYVGDNGRPTDKKRIFCRHHNCEYLELPFDCGVSETRNKSFKQISPDYKYVAVIEDDIIFTDGTALETWRQILDDQPDIGIIGGLLRLETGKEQHYEADVSIEGDTHYIRRVTEPVWEKTKSGKRFFLCDMVLNIFMMRRKVWFDCPWDGRFKAVFEHSDFFLSLKMKTHWKVAYYPDVWMIHAGDEENAEFKKYRNRKVGWHLFGQKWKVDWSWSDWNPINPVKMKGEMSLDNLEKDTVLDKAVIILEHNKVKWWLEAGTCLGAIRENDFIEGDPDIDIGIAPENLSAWDDLEKDFIEAGFILYKEWTWKGKRIELSFKAGDIKIDLFFFYEKGDWYWHGAFGPDKTTRLYTNFLPHAFTKSLFTNLQEFFFHDHRCFVPSPPEQYLFERYGPEWERRNPIYRYWTDCRAVDYNLFKRSKPVFIGGVWDLFHIGHLNILERCRKLGTKLIVGVLTDDAAERYKPKPIIPFEQRRRIIESLKIADLVIEQNDTDPTKDLEKHKIIPAYLVHGTDWKICPGENYVRTGGGKVVFLPYTDGISTSRIKNMILGRETIDLTGKGMGRTGKTVAVCIKTFMRDAPLQKTIAAVEKFCPFPYRLYIADDGRISDKKEHIYQQLEKAGHMIFRLPFNCGISIGRNTMVKQVEEDYLLLMDDDIELMDKDSMRHMKEVLEKTSDVGITAGVLYKPNGEYFANEGYARGLELVRENGVLFRYAAKQTLKSADGILFVYADQVVNFFLARREVFGDIHWDPRIRIEYEHMDFFLNLKKTKWRAAVCLEAKAVHQITINDPEYNEYRHSAPRDYFMSKHGLVNIINKF